MPSKRELRKERRMKEQRRKQILGIGAVVIGVLIIASVFIIPKLSKNKTTVNPLIATPPEMTISQRDGTNLGDPNAPVKVEIYSNFECSHCQTFIFEQEPYLLENYVTTGKVYYSYISLAYTFEPTEASYCALEQNKFWEFRNYVYYNITNTAIGGMTDDNLIAIAQLVGLDIDQFENCYFSHKYQQKVMDNSQYAQANGVPGTPAFIVNGGEPIYSNELFPAIEAALNE